jgi:predicted nucleic acid-binding Zn ribbon protein
MTRDPVELRDSLAAVARTLKIPTTDAFTALTNAWPEVVGEALVDHAALRSVRDGVCTIAVDGPGWATQLRYAERQLVERAERRCGPGVVTSIRVVVEGPGTTSR